jgi:uncharacterized Zn finger protein (UPF0148 family)
MNRDCPTCGASASQHTGTYCQVCGEPLDNERAVTNPATDAQIKYITDLAKERDIDEAHRIEILERCQTGEVSKQRASDWINRLLEKPRLSSAPARGKIAVAYEDQELDSGVKRVGYVNVPEVGRVLRGHYAIDTSDDATFTNATTFFHVWVGDRGGWKVFMEVSDDQHELSSWGTKRAVIEKIARDPLAASALWGLEHSRCGRPEGTTYDDRQADQDAGARPRASG